MPVTYVQTTRLRKRLIASVLGRGIRKPFDGGTDGHC